MCNNILKPYNFRNKKISKVEFFNIEELPRGNFFYKYMDLEAALKSLGLNNDNNTTLRFVEPSSWEDEYEGRFYNANYENVDPKNENNPFLYACCMTSKSENEAAWSVYSHGKRGLAAHCVEFKINRRKLREELSKSKQVEGSKVYIGKVAYISKGIIDHLHETTVGKQDKNNDDYYRYFKSFGLAQYLQLLLLKRNAYKHEEEIRIFIIPQKNEEKYKGKRYDDKNNKAQFLLVDFNWIKVLDRISIDNGCSEFEKQLLKNQINTLINEQKMELGPEYDKTLKKLDPQAMDIHRDSREKQITIESPKILQNN